MYHTRAITNDLYWVGGNDRRLALFESAYPIPRGVSYNSYIYKDEKNVLLDTVDAAVADAFFENIDHVLKGETIDYIIVNHMEPDHSATLGRVLRAYPNATVVCNKMLYAMIGQYFDVDLKDRVHFVAEGDTLCTGKHTFAFVMAPMVHWPEVMMTYEVSQKVLFSADAFGTFGAIGGSIFADEVHFERDWLDDARRYYTNIVGKYGTQVQNVLKKAQGLDIDYICPLHGPVWRDNIEWFVKKYDLWSSYKPETNGVLIAYSSVYGNTKNVAEILGGMLAKRGVKEMETYDVAVTHPSYLVSKAFEYSHIVFATTTYNAGIFVAMENLLHDIAAHNLQNRTIALIENGSWAPAAGQKMKELLQPLKGTSFVNDMFTIRSTMKADQMGQLEQLADSIMSTLPQPKPETDPAFKISYGLYILSANQNGKDNACIINTAQLVTSMPKKLCVTVNKSNYTHEMIDSTKRFNISVLTQTASFDIFKHFGFCSGRDVDKTTDYPGAKRSANGLLYFTKCCNAFISVKVTQQVDCGSHTMFIGDVEEEEVFSSAPSVTYTYYQQHIKPAPKAAESKKKGFVCKICGYVYEGDVLPADFICPICKHPASDFEPLG